MKAHLNNKYIILLLILIFSLVIRIIPFYLSGMLPYQWDSLSISYSTIKLIETGEFQPNIIAGTGYYPNASEWIYYPLSQIMLYNIYIFSDIPPYILISLLSIILSTLIPLLVFVIVRKFYSNVNYAIISSFFASVVTVPFRDIVYATLHTIQGYILLLSIILIIFKINTINIKNMKYKWIILAIIFTLSLSITHQLSFLIVISCFLLYFLFNRNFLFDPKKLLVLGILIIFIGFAATSFYQGAKQGFISFIIKFFYEGSAYGMHDLSTVRPIWNHPALWGYILTSLGVFGLAKYLVDKNQQLRGLVLSLFLVPLVFGHSYVIGFNVAPERFLYYDWIPLILLAPVGFYALLGYLKKTKSICIFFVFLIVLGSIFQGTNFMLNFVDISKKSLPQEEDMDAFIWIKENTPKNATILTNHQWPTQQTKWIPILAERPATYLLIPLAKDIKITPPTEPPEPVGLIGNIISPFMTQELLEREKILNEEWWKHGGLGSEGGVDPYIMFKYVDSAEAQELMNSYNIKYIYTWDNTPENRIISKSSNFRLAYKTGSVRIYEYLL